MSFPRDTDGRNETTICLPSAKVFDRAAYEVGICRFSTAAAGLLLLGAAATRAHAQTSVAADQSLALPTIEVTAASTRASAGAGTPTGPGDAASAFTLSGDDINRHIFSRPGEALESVPGLIVTQHSGEGKANQYFLRGFNLDHGTDLAIFVDGMPINMPTHAHGQGYADLNFLMPELVGSVDVKKGVYFADEGDFATAGAVHINLVDSFDGNMIETTVGSFHYLRTLGIGSTKVGDGNLLVAGEVGAYDGPWVYPDRLRKLNGLVRYSQGTAENGFALTGMGYANQWHSSDQIPERAVDAVGLYGAPDPSDGGNTQRFSLSGRWAQSDAAGAWKANAFVVRSALNLWNDFTYYLQDPVNGDQFHQHETRTVAGANASYTFKHAVFGRRSDTELGVQTRFDDVHLLLTNTLQRQDLSTIRQDDVKEGSVGVFVQNTTHWADRFRTDVGWRGDLFAASNDAIGTPANSGTPLAAVSSPKATFIFGPFAKTEYFINFGEGFHSNDVRGVTTVQEPTDANQRLQRASFLTKVKGAEVGLRTKLIEDLNSSVTAFVLEAASENVFAGDSGDTQPTILPIRRVGVEWTNDYRPFSWLGLEGDVAYTRTRFLGYDTQQAAVYDSLAGYPQAQIGNAPGTYVPGAATVVASASVTIGETTGWFAGLQYRFFGPRPLTEDNVFRSPATGLVNGRVGYHFESGWRLQLDGFNLTNSRSDQITYAYGSLLKTDSLYALCNAAGSTVPSAVCQNGVMDRVFKPVEPVAVRLTLAGRF